MKKLIHYVQPFKKTLLWALLLATINQTFSLINPQIFRLLIDNYANKINELTQSEFLTWVLWLTAALIWAAFVSRVAKTFQDYYANKVSQSVWNKLYADVLTHTLNLPYKVFEDQRSWSLLDKLQKAKQTFQDLITVSINSMFLYDTF